MLKSTPLNAHRLVDNDRIHRRLHGPARHEVIGEPTPPFTILPPTKRT